MTEESLILALRPTLASKQYGSEDLLAQLVAEAVLAVMPKNPSAVSCLATQPRSPPPPQTHPLTGPFPEVAHSLTSTTSG